LAPHPAGEGVSSFLDGRYVYMDDLKQLASMLPLPRETPPPPEVRRVVITSKVFLFAGRPGTGECREYSAPRHNAGIFQQSVPVKP